MVRYSYLYLRPVSPSRSLKETDIYYLLRVSFVRTPIIGE